MVKQIDKANFNQLAFPNSGEQPKPTIGDDLQLTLTRLMGWNSEKEQWELIEADDDGRLIVSSGSLRTNENTSSQVTADGTAANALSESPTRRQYIIQNVGSVSVYMGFGEDAVVGEGMLLQSGATWIDDVWYGRISVITSGSTCDLIIQDMT